MSGDLVTRYRLSDGTLAKVHLFWPNGMPRQGVSESDAQDLAWDTNGNVTDPPGCYHKNIDELVRPAGRFA